MLVSKPISFKGYNFGIQSPIDKENGDTEVAFLTSNDSHGRVSKLPKLKTARNEFKSAFLSNDTADFVFTTGDNIMGLDKKKHNIWVDFLVNHFKPDALAPGNHEFDKGSDYMAGIINKMDAPTLAANLDIEANDLMVAARKNKKLMSSTIIERKGQKIGLVGATTSEVHRLKSKNEMNGVIVRDFEQTKQDIQAEVDKLKDEGINKIVLLSHLGYLSDVVLAGGFEQSADKENDLSRFKRLSVMNGIQNLDGIRGVDVIIGAHTHDKISGATRLKNPKSKSLFNRFIRPDKKKINLITPPDAAPVLVTQAGENNDYVGFIDIVFDKNGVIKTGQIINKNINIDRFDSDKELAKEMAIKLGTREKLFTLSEPFIDPRRVDENAVGDLMADSILEKANKELPEGQKADIAFIHGADPRGDMKGDVYNWDLIHDVIPFNEPVYMFKMSEKELVDTINNTAKVTFYDDQKPVLLHPSANLRYEINKLPTKSENYDDLFFVNKITLNGKSIDLENPNEEKNINTLVEEYLMIGDPKVGGKEGFKYLCVEGSSDYISGKIDEKPKGIIKDFGWAYKDGLAQYAKNKFGGKTISLVPDGRIKIIDNSESSESKANPSFGKLTAKMLVSQQSIGCQV